MVNRSAAYESVEEKAANLSSLKVDEGADCYGRKETEDRTKLSPHQTLASFSSCHGWHHGCYFLACAWLPLDLELTTQALQPD